MYYLYIVFGILISYFAIKLIRVWSYNIIFMVIKQPNLWILFMALLGTFVAYLSTLFPKDRIGADVFLWTVIILHASALFEINQKTKDYSPE